MKLLVATQNSHKLSEIREMLPIDGLEVVGSDLLETTPSVVEDGESFEENALIKARAYAAASGQWSMGDDSGICVDALDGKPGIRSARFAGEWASDAENNRKLLDLMREKDDRKAWFYCALGLVSPDGREWVVSGRCDGRLLEQERGIGGFGYDPLFVPEGSDRTFSEMTQEEKNLVSHRRRALDAARCEWSQLLGVAG